MKSFGVILALITSGALVSFNANAGDNMSTGLKLGVVTETNSDYDTAGINVEWGGTINGDYQVSDGLEGTPIGHMALSVVQRLDQEAQDGDRRQNATVQLELGLGWAWKIGPTGVW